MLVPLPPSASATFTNLRVISFDGMGEATRLGPMYKDMTVDRLKRAVTATLRRPAYTWEDMNLYHLGVVMKNGRSSQIKAMG